MLKKGSVPINPRQVLVMEKNLLRFDGWRRPSMCPSTWHPAHVYKDNGPTAILFGVSARL